MFEVKDCFVCDELPSYPDWLSIGDLTIAEALEEIGFAYVGEVKDFQIKKELHLETIGNWSFYSGDGEIVLDAVCDGALYFLALDIHNISYSAAMDLARSAVCEAIALIPTDRQLVRRQKLSLGSSSNKKGLLDELGEKYPITFKLKNLVIAKGLLDVGYEYYKYDSGRSIDSLRDSYLETVEGWSLYLRCDEEKAAIALIATCQKHLYLLWLDDYRMEDPIALTKNAIARAVQSLSLKYNQSLIKSALYGQNRRSFTLDKLGVGEAGREIYSPDTIENFVNYARTIAAIEQFKTL